MSNDQIEKVIDDLIFIRAKLYNGIFGERATLALTNAISLLRELQSLKTEKKAHWNINPDGYYPQCSNCGAEPESGKLEYICRTCGAVMEELS